MSNTRRPRKPWLRIPRRPNVADLAWREHRRKTEEAARQKARDRHG